MKHTTKINRAIMAMLLLLFTSGLSFAQDSHVAILLNTMNSRLNYGGMNDAVKGYKKDLRGIQAGLSFQAGITKSFSVVTEAYFAKKGGALKANNPVNGVGSSLKLYSVEIPLLARVHAGKFYFNAGPYGNHIFSGKQVVEGESSRISFGRGPGEFVRWEAGVQGGAGYQFRIKKTRMAFDVRYIHGMTSLSRTSDLYNRTINISVLALRPLKKVTN